MKGRECFDMHDPIDAYICQGMKNWAAQHHPPANGRARLLLSATSPATPRRCPLREETNWLLRWLQRDASIADQAIELYNLPWLWAVHMAFAPLRRVA